MKGLSQGGGAERRLCRSLRSGGTWLPSQVVGPAKVVGKGRGKK